jgi:hypothetical protein
MRPIRKYQEGGNVRSLLNRLAAQSKPLPAFQPQPAVSESTMTRRPDELEQQLSAGQAMDFAGMLRDMQRAKEREEFESVMGKGYPMDSGSIESVTPMKFFTPVGDVEDIASGLQMAGRGAMEGDLGKVAGGAGLSLAAGAMAFLPGNLSMMRSYAQSVNNPALDRIFKGVGRELESPEDIALVAEKFSKEERAAIAKDAQELIDLSFDEFSGLDLSNTERLVLEEIKDIAAQEAPSASLKLAPTIEETRGVIDMPDEIGDFAKQFDQYGPNEVGISYTDRMGNYVEINSASVSERLPDLAKEYGDRYAHSMNMDMTELKQRPGAGFAQQREQANVMNTLMSNIQKGDLIGIPKSGSLSSDSYPMFLTQLRKGKKYLSASDEVKEKIKERGVKLIDKVPEDQAISYRTLNDMGKFRNYFGIPEKEFRTVNMDGMLTGSGTYFGRENFSSVKEANDYLKGIKEKYIDPKLKEAGLPPARIVSHDIEGHTKILFPYPVVEKLRFGGKIGLKKNRKGGLIAKKR